MTEKKSTSTGEQADGGSDLGRASYRALQARNAVTIFAFGVHPTPGYTDFFKQLPIRIFPPQFSFHSIPPGGMVPQVLTPFSIWVMFGASEPIKTVTVHDADGAHEIEVEQPSKNLAEAEERETWISGNVVREGAAARFAQPTTMATGEEGGGPTTMATGEEEARIATTLAVGEEDPPMTTMALGEEGATTLRLGEEGPTTMALGEEGQTTFGLTATTLAVGEEGPTTMALGEETGGTFVQNNPFGSF